MIPDGAQLHLVALQVMDKVMTFAKHYPPLKEEMDSTPHPTSSTPNLKSSTPNPKSSTPKNKSSTPKP